MTAPNITSLLQDDSRFICTETNLDGELTVILAHDHRVVSQLVRETMLTQIGSIAFAPDIGIDWQSYRAEGADYSFLAVDLRAAIGGVYGVRSVDLSTATYEPDANYLNIEGICWTSDCANSINYGVTNA